MSATTESIVSPKRDWREELEPKTLYGDEVVHAEWCSKAREWRGIVLTSSGYICVATDSFIPKQKPKKYRPYKRGEVNLGDKFKSKDGVAERIVERMVTEVYESETVRLGSMIFSYADLFKYNTHLDGSPAGREE